MRNLENRHPITADIPDGENNFPEQLQWGTSDKFPPILTEGAAAARRPHGCRHKDAGVTAKTISLQHK